MIFELIGRKKCSMETVIKHVMVYGKSTKQITHMLRDEKRCIPVNPVYLKEKKGKRILYY